VKSRSHCGVAFADGICTLEAHRQSDERVQFVARKGSLCPSDQMQIIRFISTNFNECKISVYIAQPNASLATLGPGPRS
jgi:hypothetical protein